VLENTPREFGGVGGAGCGVVNIVLVGRRSAAAHRKKKIERARQESVKIFYRVLGKIKFSSREQILAKSPQIEKE